MQAMPIDQLSAYIAMSPFIRDWGITITEASPEQQTLSLRMPWCPEGAGADGSDVWHGGPIASLLDTAGAFAATMVAGRDCGTISFGIDYLRPATGDLLATARVRKAGRSMSTVEVDVTSSDGKLVAVGRGTFYVSGS